MDALDRELLNGFQRDFPLTARPYALIGERLGLTEHEVIVRLRALAGSGFVRRVGVVLTPRRIGSGMLVAMSIPIRRLSRVAARIAALPEVNHSYERAHPINLWFVVTAPDAARVEEVVRAAEDCAGTAALRLPLVEAYHLDLGFALGNATGGTRPARAEPAPRRATLKRDERALLAALQEGIPIDVTPYAMLGEAAGMNESAVLSTLRRWLGSGLVRRIGIIVEHHRLGYRANAMAVWDVPDGEIARIGKRIAKTGLTTLCYRRARVMPNWPYNLYCMLHGKSGVAVRKQLVQLQTLCDLGRFPSQVLFSVRQFKQQGARYVEEFDGRGGSRDRESPSGWLSARGAAVPGGRAGAGAYRERADRGARAAARAGRSHAVRPAV